MAGLGVKGGHCSDGCVALSTVGGPSGPIAAEAAPTIFFNAA
jgi:hypothetical protein